MTILQIAALVMLAIIIGRLPKGRQLALLGVSALAIFWLQAAEPFVSLRYWLPFATLGITVLSWALTSTGEARSWRQNWPAIAILVLAAAVGGLKPSIPLASSSSLSASSFPLMLAAMAGVAVIALVLLKWRRANAFWLSAALIAVLLALVLLKSPALTAAALGYLAKMSDGHHPDASIALSWLGFSYVAFRLMHTIRDRQLGRMPSVSLSEYVNYVIFFPSFTAGPIDRIERFLKDLCNPLHMDNEDWIDAATRILVGLFKKFVIADLLTVISINDVLVAQVHSAAWLWVFLYAYSLRIYLDFSGYTDIAIGMGRLTGIRLPENFASPYLKPNLAQFWSSWHMTLTQWFRVYFFNPVTRAIRSMKHPIPAWMIILGTQTATMVLIALWHGITWGFAAWGLWHAAGLFIHNRWTEIARNRMPGWTQTRLGQGIVAAAGTFLTFHYVTVGWLFFTLSEPQTAWFAMRRLFGWA